MDVRKNVCIICYSLYLDFDLKGCGFIQFGVIFEIRKSEIL